MKKGHSQTASTYSTNWKAKMGFVSSAYSCNAAPGPHQGVFHNPVYHPPTAK